MIEPAKRNETPPACGAFIAGGNLPDDSVTARPGGVRSRKGACREERYGFSWSFVLLPLSLLGREG
jgi:hypothetical protein